MNDEIITSIKKDIYEYIHTNIPARIIDFNHVDMTATVQVIAKLKIRGIEQIPKAIYRVPVGQLFRLYQMLMNCGYCQK